MIHLANEFWVKVGEHPIADSDDAYCDYCQKKGQKRLIVIGIRNSETEQERDLRHVGYCCAERVHGEDAEKGIGKPFVPDGMKLRRIVFWDVRDQNGQRVAAYRLNQQGLADEHAVKVNGKKPQQEKGWELIRD